MSATAALPQVGVTPELRQSVEAALTSGETLPDFVEVAVRRALDHRFMQTEFAARGQAPSENFAGTCESYSTEEVLGELRQMTQRRRAQLDQKPVR